MNAYLARQPIFDLQNQTYAYELLFRSNNVSNEYNGTDSDESTASVLSASFFDLESQIILSGKKAFINFTANLIKRGVPKLLPADTLVVEILEDVIVDDELIENVRELKSLGYTIALDDFAFDDKYRELFALTDIVKIDFRMEKQIIEDTSYMCRYAGKIILAEKVETIEEVEYAKSLGSTYMQGYYFAKPTIVTRKTVNPMQSTFIQLLQELNKPHVQINELVRMISMDGALVIKLLKLVNSAFYSRKNPISTIRQAIIMIGIEPLKEWIYLIGLKDYNNSASDELLKLAFLRARFCQEISLNISSTKEYHNEMYLMGMISLMHVFFGTTLKDMLNELPVSQIIKDGIMGTGGVFSEIYKLCYAYERAAWKMVDKATESLGLSPEDVSRCYITCVNTVHELWVSMSGK